MAMRPSSRMARKLRNPSPRSPRRLAAGTRQPSKTRPWVSEACQPIFRYGGSTVSPGVPDGMTMALISPGPVVAVTVMIDVIGVPELVMKALAPSITHSPAASSSTARVLVAPASLPPSGSVRPKAPRARPAHRSESHRWRCSSLPNWKTGLAPRPTPASRVMAIDESTRASSSTAMQTVVKSEFEPPYSSGNGRPNRPSSPMASTVSTGKVWVRSHSSAKGAISRSAKSRTTLRNCSCSGERSRFIDSRIVGS